jgi:hypothetical protein
MRQRQVILGVYHILEACMMFAVVEGLYVFQTDVHPMHNLGSRTERRPLGRCSWVPLPAEDVAEGDPIDIWHTLK